MDTEINVKIANFFAQFKNQIYKKGEILIRADEAPSGIFYIKSGMVKEYLLTKNGDELVVNIFKPGSFSPMSWAMNDTPNEFYFEAVTQSEIYKAPREKVITFLKENTDVLFDLLARVYRGTDGLLLRMAYLMSGEAYERLITELMIHAKRFGEKGGNNEIVIQISEKDLADRAGLTRETISRELKKLKERQLATFAKGQIVIPNIERLEEELL